ncbi:hypothetical protein J6590_091912 [Homalodisca vitripennis]|nr:hypothetical protein J6590_091912 [Homalodisca vitripennis]
MSFDEAERMSVADEENMRRRTWLLLLVFSVRLVRGTTRGYKSGDTTKGLRCYHVWTLSPRLPKHQLSHFYMKATKQ